MYTQCMRRIQLYLDEELDEAIGRRAVEEGVPKAVVIRQVLRSSFPPGRGSSDPSSRLIGIYDGGDEESAIVDDVVYGA